MDSIMIKDENVIARFLSKTDKTDTCWIWNASFRGHYGAFKYNGKLESAHRISYRIHTGDIPENMFVCHTYDNRRCVNPAHLFLGTSKDNYDDAVRKGRIDKKKNGLALKKHPSQASYSRGCRCKECKELHTSRQRKYRLIKKILQS